MNKHLVAVYGSLKADFMNNHVLSDSLKVADGYTSEAYTMYSLGSFPCITHEPTAPVIVEVYKVNDYTLQRLDNLEGHPKFYRRDLVDILCLNDDGGGETIVAWIYFIADEVPIRSRKVYPLFEDNFFNWGY